MSEPTEEPEMMLSAAKQPEMLQAGFKAQFIKKVSRMDWTGLDRTEIMIEVALVACPLLIGAVGGWMNARRWRQRRFTETIHYSLNTVTEDKVFRFRTIAENPIASVLHPEGVKRVQKACENVTNDHPIVELDKTTTWLVNNAIANQLSAACGPAFLARDMGVEGVTSEWYVIALTAEPTGQASMKKIRAMVIKESLLRALSDPEVASTIKLESRYYKIRWELLLTLARSWAESDFRHNKKNPKFFKVELCSLGKPNGGEAYSWLSTYRDKNPPMHGYLCKEA